MIFELKDVSKVAGLFEGWHETLIYSCLQKIMGKIFVTDIVNPVSACALVGCFCFYSGKPDEELVKGKPKGFIIMTPQNEEWASLIEKCFQNAKKTVRYAIKKNTNFDSEKLKSQISLLPLGYELKEIDADLYDKCISDPFAMDFVSSYESKEQFLNIGKGFVILKDGIVVSGASSYSSYSEGIEIEVDTVESERRKHLATIACSALVLKCLENGLYPSWDAHNMISVRLAEKLGYEFDREYTVYEVDD